MGCTLGRNPTAEVTAVPPDSKRQLLAAPFRNLRPLAVHRNSRRTLPLKNATNGRSPGQPGNEDARESWTYDSRAVKRADRGVQRFPQGADAVLRKLAMLALIVTEDDEHVRLRPGESISRGGLRRGRGDENHESGEQKSRHRCFALKGLRTA